MGLSQTELGKLVGGSKTAFYLAQKLLESGNDVRIIEKDIEKCVMYPNSARDASGRLLVAAAIGDTPDVLTRVEALLAAGADKVIDSPDELPALFGLKL